MDEDEVFEHLQDAHGMDGWTLTEFQAAYPGNEPSEVHGWDHQDPEESGVDHSHPER